MWAITGANDPGILGELVQHLPAGAAGRSGSIGGSIDHYHAYMRIPTHDHLTYCIAFRADRQPIRSILNIASDVLATGFGYDYRPNPKMTVWTIRQLTGLTRKLNQPHKLLLIRHLSCSLRSSSLEC